MSHSHPCQSYAHASNTTLCVQKQRWHGRDVMIQIQYLRVGSINTFVAKIKWCLWTFPKFHFMRSFLHFVKVDKSASSAPSRLLKWHSEIWSLFLFRAWVKLRWEEQAATTAVEHDSLRTCRPSPKTYSTSLLPSMPSWYIKTYFRKPPSRHHMRHILWSFTAKNLTSYGIKHNFIFHKVCCNCDFNTVWLFETVLELYTPRGL